MAVLTEKKYKEKRTDRIWKEAVRNNNPDLEGLLFIDDEEYERIKERLSHNPMSNSMYKLLANGSKISSKELGWETAEFHKTKDYLIEIGVVRPHNATVVVSDSGRAYALEQARRTYDDGLDE